MADFPALPLWTDAYLADTRHLTTEQHGAYLLLLMEAWRRKDCALPNDDRLLARLVGVSAQKWCRMKPIMLEFWELSDGYLKQNRLKKERTYCEQRSQKQRERANTRWLKTNNSIDAVAVPEGMPDRCRSDAPTPIPLPIKIQKEGESSTLSSTRVDSSADMIAVWSVRLPELSQPRTRPSPQRRQKLNARLKEFCGGDIEGWRSVCQKISECPHLMGDNDRGWTASLDWVLEPRNLTKILEGNYDARQPVPRETEAKGVMADAKRILQRAAAARDRRDHPSVGGYGEEQRADGKPRGGPIAVLPDGREVPLHSADPDGRPVDCGEPLVSIGDQGLRGRATNGAGPCHAAAGETQRSMEGNQEQFAPDVGSAIGHVVSARAWPSADETTAPARKPGDGHGPEGR